MERGLINSLSWPKNNQAIQHAIYHVFTSPGEADRVKKIVSKIIPEEQIQVTSLLEVIARSRAHPTAANFLLLGFVSAMHESLASGEQLLIAPPDTVFSEGTIPNLLDFGSQPDTCIAIPHPRVEPTFLVSMNSESHGAIDSPAMVRIAWENLHRAWSESRVGRDQTGTYIGGVSWRETHDGSYAVQHMLPTNYLCNFTADDLTFFTSPKSGFELNFGNFDHTWPSECLIPKGRQRTLASSDLGFVVELTDPNCNIPPLRNANPFQHDAFARQLAHNCHNKQVITTFRPG